MVQTFDRETFERALPVKRVASLSPMVPAPIETKLWKPLGLVDGEFSYLVPVREPFSIMIRSSIHADGVSASTGEDSIRCWLVNENMKPWGSKIGRYITRVPGWEQRLIETLRALYKMALLIDKCSHCGQWRKVFKVKKSGPHKGKLFLRCTSCAFDSNKPPHFLEMK